MNNVPEQPIESNIVSPPPVSRKRSGALAKIISIVIILGIIGAGTALATRIWDPVWSPFRPSPEKVIASMSEKMLAVKSVHSDMKINIDIKGQNPLKAAISFSGDSDNSDLNNPKGEGDLVMSLTMSNVFGAGSEQTISTKAKIKMLSQTEGYFNIEELNVPSLVPILMMMGIDLDNIVGVWIKIPIEDKLGQGANTQTAALTEQMEKIISESKIYVVKKQLPDQIIEDQKMYHYSVALDNDKTAKLIGDLMKETMKQSNLYQPGQEIAGLLGSGAIKGMISEFLNKIGEISAELSIGKKDNLLYSLKMEKNIDLSKIDSKLEGSFDFDFETNNSKFNQPVKVEAPAIFKNFDEVFPPLLSSPFSI